MTSAIAAFFTHFPESISLLVAGVAMTATAAGLRNLLKVSKTAKPEDVEEQSLEEHRTEG